VVPDPGFFLLGIAIIGSFLLLSRFRPVPDLSAIAVIGIGFFAGILIHGVPQFSLIPPPQLVIPQAADISSALTGLVLPQVVLTVTNAILATSLLTRDLFARTLPAKHLSTTIGLMNLTSAPFGGFPISHGANGLAAQYRFGARTGGANIIAGSLFIILALIFAAPQVLSVIAAGALGSLLVFVGIEMGRHGLKTDSVLVTGVMALLALVSPLTVAFLVGMVLAFLKRHLDERQAGPE
jgi:MFS superfamily sulfate permease-like transporter